MDLIASISTQTGIAIPVCLVNLKNKKVMHTDSIAKEEVDAYLRRVSKELP
jgi:hypothetical protein